ncbi:AAA family ATPase [Hoeflea sp. AS16]|uniref:AAA family ATPase n=1 Tax=Hoeflea sp. AS16 TaxID=3135779 RepID=UPI00317247E0
MRYVNRNAVPAPKTLASSPFNKMRESYLAYLRLDEKQRSQTTPPDRHLPYDDDLDRALSELFSDQCAFCESRTKLTAYRFRPTSDALPVGKDQFAFMAYGWLADAWQNLYPVCRECRPKQLNFFPVATRRSSVPSAPEYKAYADKNDGLWHLPVSEKNLLLDPCNDRDIARHLILADNGFLTELSARGEATIAHFNLNRLSLVNRRGIARERLARDVSLLSSRPDSYFASKAWVSETEFPGLMASYIKSTRSKSSGQPAISAPVKGLRKPAKASGPKKDALSRWQLATVKIRSFKSLEQVEFEMPARNDEQGKSLTPALMILGENATGKSSILEAITLTLASKDARQALGIKPENLLLNPTFMGDQKKRRRSSASVHIGFTDGNGKSLEVGLKLTSRGFTVDGKFPPGIPVFAYGAYRHYLNDFLEWEPHRNIVSLFKSDSLLSNPEKWLLEISQTKFNMVVRSLRHVFGIGEDFNVIERDQKAKRCMVVVEWANGKLSKTPLSSVSSGFRTILALTCDMMRWLLDEKLDWDFQTLNDAHGIVMIDEVEAHLHPRWKVRIMEGLRKALPKMTFIVTTHDPLCVRGMLDEEVMVLQRLPGPALDSNLPVAIETLTKLPNVSQLTIEQLLTSDLFSLFDTDDPVSGKAMAELADSLVKSRSEPIDENSPAARMLQKFRREIEEALPIGNTEVSRIVHEAVSSYIIKRGNMNATARVGLREDTKKTILEALERPYA